MRSITLQRPAKRLAVFSVVCPFRLSRSRIRHIAGTVLDPGGSDGSTGYGERSLIRVPILAVELTTDQNGDLISQPLRIRTIALKRQKNGFKRLIQDGIEIRVQDRLQIALSHMEVGRRQRNR